MVLPGHSKEIYELQNTTQGQKENTTNQRTKERKPPVIIKQSGGRKGNTRVENISNYCRKI